MAKKTRKTRKTNKINKPTLIKAGNHLIDPTDIACISKIRNRGLYIVRLKSQPNMEYPIWVTVNEINLLLNYFNIKAEDISEEIEEEIEEIADLQDFP